MEFYRVSAFLSVKYREYISLEQMVDFSFTIPNNTLQSAGLHILTYGVNNLTLAVL